MDKEKKQIGKLLETRTIIRIMKKEGITIEDIRENWFKVE